MAYNTSNMLGADFGSTYTPASAGGYTYGQKPPFELGTVTLGTDGSEWVYVVASGAVTGPGYVCNIGPEAWTATMLSTSNDVYGTPVGVSPVAAASGDYFWLQTSGAGNIRAEQDALAFNNLAPTADAGQLDDAAATIGSFFIRDMVLTTARGGTDGLAPGQWSNPRVDLVPDTTP